MSDEIKFKRFSSQIESRGYAKAIEDLHGYKTKTFYIEEERKFAVAVPKKWRIL